MPSTFYRPLDFAVVRAPVLPVEQYRALRGRAADTQLAAQPLAGLALRVASPSLADAAARAAAGAVPAAARGKILRYLIRMSTRPTPFGLCAGVGLAGWGDRTDIAIAAGPRTRRTRPDMGWLLSIALDQEADPAVRRDCHLMVNTCAFEHEGRIRLTEQALPGRGPAADVSVRATPVVRRALALARRPVAHAELVDGVVAATPGASPAKVAVLLDQLWEAGLLLTDLRPPLTADPVRHLVRRLDAAPAAGSLRGALAGVVTAAGQVDGSRECDAAGALAAVAVRARSLAPEPAGPASRTGDVLQVDSGLSLRGDRIASGVAATAARAADLLFRMHPVPGGSAMLAGYRGAFVERYGHDRLVGVAELLDPRSGLGPPESVAHLGDGHGGHGATGQARDATLVELACGALRDGRTEVDLDGELVAALTTWTPQPDRLPASLDLSTIVLAPDTAAVDRGDFRLMVGPGVGAPAAGRILGRFADVLGPAADAALHRVAAAEQQRLPGRVHAELVYLPATLRAANVAIRPAVRDHEIPVGVTAGVAAERVVAVDELAVGVRGGRLRLWWLPRETEVVVTAGHMLTTRGAPAICRFLHDVGRDGITDLHPFDWGGAAAFPALPRVVSGRVVLAPATWSLARSGPGPAERAGGFAAWLDRWRERWCVPSQVYLAEADNRLLLDLDDPEQREVLRRELRRTGRPPITVQEPLPAPADAWLPGPGGRFLCEVVVPLVQRAPAGPADRMPPAPASVPPQVRRRPPGSDWLYLKLYGPPGRQDELVADRIRSLAAGLAGRGLVDSWFFVRYADPEPHVRLRLHGAPAALAGPVLATAAAWAGRLVAEGECGRWSTDVYDREVERYGGARGIDLAESIFAVDAVAVADLLAVLRSAEPVDPVALLAVTVEDLLAGLGFDAPSRARWFGAWPAPSRASGPVHRARQVELRALLAGGAAALGSPGGQVAAVLAARRRALAPLAADLHGLAAAGELTVPPADVVGDLVHLHCNRLLGDRDHERLVLDLLRRTYDGLRAEAAAARR